MMKKGIVTSRQTIVSQVYSRWKSLQKENAFTEASESVFRNHKGTCWPISCKIMHMKLDFWWKERQRSINTSSTLMLWVAQLHKRCIQLQNGCRLQGCLSVYPYRAGLRPLSDGVIYSNKCLWFHVVCSSLHPQVWAQNQTKPWMYFTCSHRICFYIKQYKHTLVSASKSGNWFSAIRWYWFSMNGMPSFVIPWFQPTSKR